MADNSSVPVASGNETFANNDIGGVKYPYSKVLVGTAGATTAIAAASGAAANALRTVSSTDDPILGALTETAPASDTASSGLNGRLQRIAQRLTTLIAGIVGSTAHDAAGGSVNPLAVGGYASAAAPTDVSADADIVRAWLLRNGAQATVITAGGALIGGDASNGLDVDVTRAPAAAATTDNVGAALMTDKIMSATTALTPKFAKIAASSSGNNTLVSAVTSKKIRVLAYNFTAAGAVNAKFQDGAGGTDLTGLTYCDAAGAGKVAGFNPVGWFETSSNTLLNLNLSGAVAVGGELVYVEV